MMSEILKNFGVRLKVSGYVQWCLVRNDFVIDRGEGPNLVTTSGLNWIAQRISGDTLSTDDMQYIKAGTSDQDPALTDTDIVGTLFKGQVCGDGGGDPAGDQGGQGINPGEPNTILWRAKFVYDADVDTYQIIREMVLSTHITAPAGVCMARFLTGPQGIRGYVDGDSIVVVWALTIGG